MTILKYYFFVLLIGLFSSCSQTDQTPAKYKVYRNFLTDPFNKDYQYFDDPNLFNPKDLTPISFIQLVSIKSPMNCTKMLDDFPDNWVKYSDIETLVLLINSKEKCNCILNPLSSHIPGGGAEIGGYAILFINSFRQKSKIELGLYNCPKTDKQSGEEILEWWRIYKQMK